MCDSSPGNQHFREQWLAPHWPFSTRWNPRGFAQGLGGSQPLQGSPALESEWWQEPSWHQGTCVYAKLGCEVLCHIFGYSEAWLVLARYQCNGIHPTIPPIITIYIYWETDFFWTSRNQISIIIIIILYIYIYHKYNVLYYICIHFNLYI